MDGVVVMNNLLIGDFEGPLDLLLHLIKQDKKDIFDISITDITKKYIDYIKKMEELNLDIASEYLVMAAELIEMKSRHLLPLENKQEDIEEIENPEEELKKRLLEYQKYKETKNTFLELAEKRSNYYTKTPEKMTLYTDKKIINNSEITANDLLNALQKLLERRLYQKPLNTKITKKELSVKERVDKIRSILKKEKTIRFDDLFDNFEKSYVIVTFLSILEMAKNGEINLKQKNNFEEIYLERVD